jgi:hypothetical protein
MAVTTSLATFVFSHTYLPSYCLSNMATLLCPTNSSFQVV